MSRSPRALDAHFSVREFVVEGDKAAWRDHFTGPQRGELLGIPATGRAPEADLSPGVHPPFTRFFTAVE